MSDRSTPLIFANASQVVTCAGARARAAWRGDERCRHSNRRGCGRRRRQGCGASTSLQTLRERFPAAREIDCRQGVLMPGLVDSHTHGVFGRPRYEEQEMRAAGLDYMEIARRGGGIHSSVRDLRTRSEDVLFELARTRLTRLASFGTTTVEVKSGYGLSLER